MSSFVTLQPRSLKQLGQLAIEQIGECVGIRWWPSTCYRRAAVYFRYLDAARAFAKLARRHGFIVTDPTARREQLNECGEPTVHPHEPVRYRGFPVVALVQADAKQPQGWRRAPAFRDQPATHAWGVITERERGRQADHRQQREADAPLEHWRDEDVERDLDAISAEVNAWWQGRGYDQATPEAYIAAKEQQRAAQRVAKRVAAGGSAVSPLLKQAVAAGVQQVEQAQAKASKQRERQQQRNRVAADDADVIAELGRWDGRSLSAEAWDAEFGIER